MFDEGISRTRSIIDLGLEHKILEKKGAWVAYNGKLIGQGREAAKQYLKNNPDCEKELEGQIKVHVSGGTVLTESVDNEQNASI
jgi:recombination protein RecA